MISIIMHTLGKKELISLFDEEINKMHVKEPMNHPNDENQRTSLFEAAEDDNILDRSKRSLGKMSWFQRLFK